MVRVGIIPSVLRGVARRFCYLGHLAGAPSLSGSVGGPDSRLGPREPSIRWRHPIIFLYSFGRYRTEMLHPSLRGGGPPLATSVAEDVIPQDYLAAEISLGAGDVIRGSRPVVPRDARCARTVRISRRPGLPAGPDLERPVRAWARPAGSGPPGDSRHARATSRDLELEAGIPRGRLPPIRGALPGDAELVGTTRTSDSDKRL